MSTLSDLPLKILVVDDERSIRRFLNASLGNRYTILEAENGGDAIQAAAVSHPDLVLLDLGLPDLDGVEVTRRIREWSAVPILVVSARGQERDKVEALDAGADDYLTKPFGTEELLARMRVALRHAARVKGEEGDSVFEAGELRVDLGARLVFLRGEEVRLTRTEYRLLAVLVQNAGRVVTHRHLLREVWGPGSA